MGNLILPIHLPWPKLLSQFWDKILITILRINSYHKSPNSLEGAGNVLLLEEDVKFCENMREYANYAYSLKDFIRKYELLQYKIEVLESTIEAKKAGLFMLGKPEVGIIE